MNQPRQRPHHLLSCVKQCMHGVSICETSEKSLDSSRGGYPLPPCKVLLARLMVTNIIDIVSRGKLSVCYLEPRALSTLCAVQCQ